MGERRRDTPRPPVERGGGDAVRARDGRCRSQAARPARPAAAAAVPAAAGVRGRPGTPRRPASPGEEAGPAAGAFAVERKPVAPRPARLDRRGGASGVDRRTAQRLARGQTPIEDRIDLHGMTQAKARRALERFLVDAEGAGRRCVLVITGKGAERDRGEGAMPDRDAGVLRRSLPRWLALPGLRERVVAYCPAIPRHGGAGAFYILLRRRR